MATRLPASQHTREELTALIEGRLSTASAKDEHGARPGQGYRNGYRTGRLRTAEGLMEYAAPQIAGRDEPFRSAIRQHLRGLTQGLEDLAIEMLAPVLRRLCRLSRRTPGGDPSRPLALTI